MERKQRELTEGLKEELKRLWAAGHRELVILTFKMAAGTGDTNIAKWIHSTFKHDYTEAELEDLGVFAANLVVMRFAQQLAANVKAQSSVDPVQAAKDVIAKAMAH